MSSIHVPDSRIELTDGSIVMLNRFPGTKWVVHEGWYTYNGRQYSGWYFCSIPANTVLPMNQQDLTALVVVSQDTPDVDPDVPPVGPPHPDHHHHHPPIPPYPPYPPQPPFPPVPPKPPYPPVPPYPPQPDVDPDRPAFFSVKLKAQLDEAFISVPNLKQRDAFITDELPNGKIVRVNSVEGKPQYYVWNKVDDEWQDLDFAFLSDIEDTISDYYDKSEIDSQVEALNSEIEALHSEVVSVAESSQTSIEEAVQSLESQISDTEDRLQTIIDDQVSGLDVRILESETQISELTTSLQDLRETVESSGEVIDGEISSMLERIVALEDAIFNMQQLLTITSENTVIVSHEGSIADSDYSIGDEEIGETAEYANPRTLATEKAVASLVENSIPSWGSF